MEAVINLEDFRVRQGNKVSVVFTGRDRGAEVRKRSNIDEIANKNEKVKIKPKIYNKKNNGGIYGQNRHRAFAWRPFCQPTAYSTQLIALGRKSPYRSIFDVLL